MRALRLTDRFYASRRVLVQPRTPTAAALTGVLARLLAGTLPGAQDFEALMPPVGVAWVRPIPGGRLWAFYRFDEREVAVLDVTNLEPVRVDPE